MLEYGKCFGPTPKDCRRGVAFYKRFQQSFYNKHFTTLVKRVTRNVDINPLNFWYQCSVREEVVIVLIVIFQSVCRSVCSNYVFHSFFGYGLENWFEAFLVSWYWGITDQVSVLKRLINISFDDLFFKNSVHCKPFWFWLGTL